MPNYSSLHEPDEENGVLFHAAETTRARWNHIGDLDSFFSRMYQYHQRHGYSCIVLHKIFELLKFVFLVVFSAYILHCINYPVLFRDVPPPNNGTKVTIHDTIIPVGQCVAHFGAPTWIALIVAKVVWLFKWIKAVHCLIHFYDMKQFFNTALKIDDKDLDNLTWHQVQTRVRTVQIEQQMCIHKRELSDLDIYHRILRQENYYVAMVNKKLLPPRLNVPFFGEWVYWTESLKFNMHLLFFWSHYSPFERPWQLREEYKKPNMRHELAERLRKAIRILAIINLILSPLIFVWQLIYICYSYIPVLRKEPGALFVRKWSLYGRMNLRHFNELDHELNARLSRAHRPATKFMAAFTSPIGTIIAENIGFYAMAFLAVLVTLSIYDEDVLSVEHVLSIITILWLIVSALGKIQPDDTTSQDLEELLNKVVAQTHYGPTDWKGQAHTSRVRKEFEQLFQYGITGIIENLLAPFIVPYVLYFHIAPRAIEFVDFYRNFTVNVVGVGDVCSFAQMDVRKHGNPEWHKEEITAPDQYSQCEDGKVELSLMHFKYTNPSWNPPESVQEFVRNVQQQGSMIASLSNQDQDKMEESGSSGWRIGEPCRSTTDVPLARSTQDEAGHMSRMWTSDASQYSIQEMSNSAMYLHNLHGNKTAELRVRSVAQETTPLLGNQ